MRPLSLRRLRRAAAVTGSAEPTARADAPERTDTIDARTRELARILWDFHAEPMTRPAGGTADLVLGLGSHDLRVAHHAALLWAQGAAPLLVFSGDRGRRTGGGGGHPRWERPEADTFAQAAREAVDVPESALLCERRATNTGENFAFSRALLTDAGVRVRRAVVTAKPYMGRRALATAAVHWPGVEWTFRAFPGGYDGYPNELYSEVELIHFLVGDLQRLGVYAERGWSAPVPVPDAVCDAQERLAALGFTDHLVPGEEVGGGAPRTDSPHSRACPSPTPPPA